MTRFPFSTAAALLASVLTLSTARADFQLGLGAGGFTGNEYDEAVGYGLEAEAGFLSQDRPVNLFFGVRASYIDGLESEHSTIFASDAADLDLFEGAVVARLLFPLGTDRVKIYGEGSVGSANLSVSGEAKAKGNVGGQDFSINSRFDAEDWVLAWGLGAGIQFDFTQNFGLRVGYNFHSFGDVKILGLDADPGSMHGLTSALVFKF